MAVQAITHRHVRELALAWWRHETSPMLLSRGTLDAFMDIESRMEAYLDGAAIDPATALAYLRATWNPDADDALADVVAGMLLLDAAAESLERQDVLDTLPGASLHARAHQCARRWAGLPAPDGESLRFIDAAGVVRGHFEVNARIEESQGAAPGPVGLCSSLLRKPAHARDTLQEAVASGEEPAVVLLAASLTGDAALLNWLLQCAAQVELTALALDAFRRITGYDALAAAGLDKTLVATMHRQSLGDAQRLATDWLHQNMSRLPSGRLLLGRRAEVPHLIDVLHSAGQADREIAVMLAPELHEFPVRARPSVQLALLQKLDS